MTDVLVYAGALCAVEDTVHSAGVELIQILTDHLQLHLQISDAPKQLLFSGLLVLSISPEVLDFNILVMK
jgi:hypothetical protein